MFSVMFSNVAEGDPSFLKQEHILVASKINIFE
jgi:hypothetical protein